MHTETAKALVCALIEAMGMTALNTYREQRGETIAYDDEAFFALIDQYKIHPEKPALAGKPDQCDMLRAAGSAIVPREPTDRMCDFGHAAGMRENAIWDKFTYEQAMLIHGTFLPTAYRAMLAAAEDTEQ